MKKAMIIAAITALLPTMASATSGLADRINEARTYSNKTVENKEMKTCMESRKTSKKTSGIETQYSDTNANDMSHKHS